MHIHINRMMERNKTIKQQRSNRKCYLNYLHPCGYSLQHTMHLSTIVYHHQCDCKQCNHDTMVAIATAIPAFCTHFVMIFVLIRFVCCFWLLLFLHAHSHTLCWSLSTLRCAQFEANMCYKCFPLVLFSAVQLLLQQ